MVSGTVSHKLAYSHFFTGIVILNLSIIYPDFCLGHMLVVKTFKSKSFAKKM